MKKKRIFIVLGVVVVLIAVGGVYIATRQPATQTGVSQFLANAQTVKVVRTNLMTSVDSSGSVIPAAKLQLSFGAAGTVMDVKAKVGDHVKKGDVLATLDATDLQSKVTQAEQAYLIQQLTYSATVQPDPSQVLIARTAYTNALTAYNVALRDYGNLADKTTVQCSQLTTAKDALDRAQTAYDRLANDHQAKNYLSGDWGPFQSVVNNLTNAQSAYDLAVSDCNVTKTNLNDSAVRSARAQVQSAKANLDNLLAPRAEKQIQAAAQLEQSRLSLVQAQQNLADATLVAPFDGVITIINITAGGASGSGAAIEMADMSQLHVDVLVDETQISTVKPGQKTQLTLDALPGITLTGQVANIDPAGTISQGVVNYNVHVNLDPTNVPVRLDMTANASIIAATRENVLAVPNAAIRTGGFAGQGGGTRQAGQGGQGGFSGQGGQGGQGGFSGQGGQGGANVQSGQAVTNTQGGQGGQQRIQGPFVLVIRNGQPVPVQVTVGLATTDLTEVSGDLHEGDQVVITTATRPSTTTTGGPGGPGGFFGGPGGRPFGGD
jgi:HlyD family secretion protein